MFDDLILAISMIKVHIVVHPTLVGRVRTWDCIAYLGEAVAENTNQGRDQKNVGHADKDQLQSNRSLASCYATPLHAET